jgi:hypothetical protein
LYPNAQPHSIYINESGLYTLLIRSKKPKAEKFFKWVVEDVLPSIRKNGIYTANKKYLKQIKQLNELLEQKNEELKKDKLRILSLENNQSNKHICNKGKYVYIVKSSLEDYINEDEPDTLKIGKTSKYKIRMSTYNTGVKDNSIVLYRAKVNDISAVENCLKSLLSKKVYRSYREYYKVTLNEAIKTIKKCIKLSGSTLISEDKYHKNFKLKRSSVLNGFTINVNDECDINQIGGEYDFDTYDSCLKMYVIYHYVLNKVKNIEHDTTNIINKQFYHIFAFN